MTPKVKVVYRWRDARRRIVNKFDVMRRKEGDKKVSLVERFDNVEDARKLKNQLV